MLLIFILTIIPLLRWFVIAPANKFVDLGLISTSFGQMSGLAGMVLFSVALILSNRSKWLDKAFGGLDNAYANHHILGGAAFTLLIFHPLLLVVRYARISWANAASLFFTNDFPVLLGIIGLGLMMILLYLTFFVKDKISYQVWKTTHSILPLALFFGGLHSFLIPSSIFYDQFLRIYILGLAIIALLLTGYKIANERLTKRKLEYVVSKVTHLADDVIEVELLPQNESLKFSPGQFIFVKFKGEGIASEAHPFSISSGIFDKSLKLAIKVLGDYTAVLNKDLKEGMAAEIEGPYGQFSIASGKADEIWVAGGIGITPFLSMARSLNKNEFNVDFFYSFKGGKDAIFLDEFFKIAKTNEKFRVFSWCSSDQGKISCRSINEIKEVKSKEIFLCGPGPMMEDLKSQFLSYGVPAENIHFEKFNL